jgi:hypothetical protein
VLVGSFARPVTHTQTPLRALTLGLAMMWSGRTRHRFPPPHHDALPQWYAAPSPRRRMPEVTTSQFLDCSTRLERVEVSGLVPPPSPQSLPGKQYVLRSSAFWFYFSSNSVAHRSLRCPVGAKVCRFGEGDVNSIGAASCARASKQGKGVWARACSCVCEKRGEILARLEHDFFWRLRELNLNSQPPAFLGSDTQSRAQQKRQT